MGLLQQNPEIDAAQLRDDVLLFSSKTNKFYMMNATAAFVWENLSAPASEEDLAERMCANFEGVEPAQALDDVRQTLQMMLERGLIVEAR